MVLASKYGLLAQFRQVQEHILAFHEGDDATRRASIRRLRDYEENKWATAPVKAIPALIETLQHLLLGGMKKPDIHPNARNPGYRSTYGAELRKCRPAVVVWSMENQP